MNTPQRVFAVLSILISLISSQSRAEHSITSIDQGHSWVSPYWGYNTPKIVSDGNTAYTVGLWGAEPTSSQSAIYQFTQGKWTQTTTLPKVYQPPTLALDAQSRLLLLHTQPGGPIAIKRAQKSGSATAFDTLPAPPDMTSAYYIGIARYKETLYLAYIDNHHNFYLCTLNLDTLQWSPSHLIQKGQQQTKPQTAWVYPILVPNETGLHLVLSNCPDGGSGNSYNEIRYLWFPSQTYIPSINEIVAQTPLGHNTFATDMAVLSNGEIHIAYMWNHRVYGDPLPESAPKVGTYHAHRKPNSSWQKTHLSPLGIAGFHTVDNTLEIISQIYGKLHTRTWDTNTSKWGPEMPLANTESPPSSAGFIDILRTESGSTLSKTPILVTDGPIPNAQDRLLWSYGLNQLPNHP